MLIIRVLVLFPLFFTALQAQEPPTDFFKKPEKNERFDAGVPIFSGMIMPVFNPELGFSFEAAGVVTFKTRRNNSYLSHSLFPALITVNPKGSFIISSHPKTYWFDDFMYIEMNTEFRIMDDNYWGVGMENGITIKKSNSTTEYRRKSYIIQPGIMFRIAGNLYTGIVFDFKSLQASDLANLILEDPEVLSYGTDIFSGGLGIMALYDKRNGFDQTSSGFYLKAKGIGYHKLLNSDYRYQKIDFDYRHFFPVIRKGSLIALRLKSTWCFGNVPWTDMPQPGGPNDLSGYYQGQYRDNNMVVFLAEYRHFFNRPGSDKLSRHGFVYWLGGGTVFEKIAEINHAILNTGAGYRYKLQPDITLRIDLGFGTEYVGIYLGLNEAF